VLQGRPHDAIAIFERCLGDVPADDLSLPAELVPPHAPAPPLRGRGDRRARDRRKAQRAARRRNRR